MAGCLQVRNTSISAIGTGSVTEALKVGAVSYASTWALRSVNAYYGNTWTVGRVVVEGAIGGAAAKALGGSFSDGFWIAAGASMARGIYQSAVRYNETWESGGDAVQKDITSHPVEGANNIGTQGGIVTTPTFAAEGGPLSTFLNKVPGVNAVAGLHDHMMIGMSEPWRGIFNYPTMLPAAAFTGVALLADHSVTLSFGRYRGR